MSSSKIDQLIESAGSGTHDAMLRDSAAWGFTEE